MKKIIFSALLISIFALSIGSMLIAQAADPVAGVVKYTCSVDGKQSDTMKACTDTCKSTGGLDGVCSSGIVVSPDYINKMIQKYTQWFMVIVGSIAVIVIIYAGLKYIMAKGDPKNTEAARKMIIYAFIGLAITLLAGGAMWTILNFIQP